MRLRGAADRVGPRFALAALLAILATGAPLRADTLAEVVRAAEAGEYARGLSLARAEPDPRIALRAELWLCYRARDFEAAYAAAERALTLDPGDLWAAERASAAALWLRDPERAERALRLFTANLNSAPSAVADPFREPWIQARSQTEALVGAAERARAARSRARLISLSILAAMLAGLAWLGVGLRRPGH